MQEEERVGSFLLFLPWSGQEERVGRARGSSASSTPDSDSDRGDSGGELRASTASGAPQHAVRARLASNSHGRVARPAVDDDNFDYFLVSISTPNASLLSSFLALISVL